MRTDGEVLWYISVVPQFVTRERVARLLALLVIDHARGVLRVTLLPPIPGMGMLMPNDAIHTTPENQPLPRAVQTEVDTLMFRLIVKHESYIDAVCRVLKGSNAEPGFTLMTRDHPAYQADQESDQVIAPLPPELPVALDS